MENYKIIRSNRKTIGIYIMQDASVEIRCPKNTSLKYIDEFVKSKEAWIEKNVHEKKRLMKLRSSFSLSAGIILYYLGDPVPLYISHVHKIDQSGIYASGTDLRNSIEQLYKIKAKKIITDKVIFFADIMNASYTSVKINSASTRWGSCSSKNALNFSWKLIIADERAVDYVVVHELAHTFEHNHSSRFWQIVKAYLPDYAKRKELLKETQKIISSQGW